ncbi:hypothetical protein GEMRC1_004702 [Eukaryota sp. GEM-RC1]
MSELELKFSLDSAVSTLSRALKALPDEHKGQIYSKFLNICPPPLKKSITRDALKLLPNCPFVLSSSAVVLFQQGAPNKAKKFFKLASKVTRHNDVDVLSLWMKFEQLRSDDVECVGIRNQFLQMDWYIGRNFNIFRFENNLDWEFDLSSIQLFIGSFSIE